VEPYFCTDCGQAFEPKYQYQQACSSCRDAAWRKHRDCSGQYTRGRYENKLNTILGRGRISINGVADALNIARSTLWEWVHNKVTPCSPEKVDKLCAHLKTTPEAIFHPEVLKIINSKRKQA
jgi:hypothetical protein